MLRKLKLLVSILITVCMFFSLSQCSQMNIDDNTKVDNIVQYSIIGNAKPYEYRDKLIPVFIFSFPLCLMLLHLFSFRENLRHELLDILSGSAVLFSMLLLNCVSDLLIAGYVALISSALFMLLSVAESIQTIKIRGGIFKPNVEPSHSFDENAA